ncbi:MAG: DUF4391 domain-containing protein [Fermentimonas sp.]
MIRFPETTYIGKRIPKEGFYSVVDFTTTQKRAFIDDIELILWRNVLSENTINVSKGEKVVQIDIIQINLKRKAYSKSILDVIEKVIPRHLLFVLKYNEEYQLCLNYKEEYQKGKFKIVESYATDWVAEEELSLHIQGLDLDRVYENFVYQIANEKIEKIEGIALSEVIQQSQEVEKLKRKISDLENKKRKEKQFNLQLRIANKIKSLKLTLKKMTNE